MKLRSDYGVKRGLRGAHDQKTLDEKRERAAEWKRVIQSKDTRKFMEFLRRFGIRDGTPQFVRACELWHAYHGTPLPHSSSQPCDADPAQPDQELPDAPQ